jgi:predicted signal transduction protein with EAL and GGDEF domain
VSIGVAELDAEMRSLESLIDATDIELYRAKGAGRNRVCARRSSSHGVSASAIDKVARRNEYKLQANTK